MGFMEWLFGQPPDEKAELPEVRDDIKDSGTVFVFGRANSGETVDEKTALQIATVYGGAGAGKKGSGQGYGNSHEAGDVQSSIRSWKE